MSRRFERRAFLKAALSCIAFVPPAASIGCSDGVITAGRSTAPVRASRFFDESRIRAAALIGQRYLAVVAPNASDVDVDALVAPTRELLESDDDDSAALAAVRARILADFTESSTIMIDGWTFAETELHLCVLARSLVA